VVNIVAVTVRSVYLCLVWEGSAHISFWSRLVQWVVFETLILCFPTTRPLTAQNMNYAGVITLGVLLLSL
jgi:uncharacterized protein (DUF983 family)